jgi:hypothetical protein
MLGEVPVPKTPFYGKYPLGGPNYLFRYNGLSVLIDGLPVNHLQDEV